MSRSLTFALLFALSAGFGTAMQRLLGKQGVDPWTYNVYYGALLLALGLAFGKPLSVPASKIGVIALSAIPMAMALYCMLSALKAGPTAEVVPITATYAVVAVIIGIAFLGERQQVIMWRVGLSTLLAVGAVYFAATSKK